MSLEKIKDKKTGRFIKKHGLRDSNLYRKWDNIKKRCNNKKARYYEYYGGRGIKVCPEWEGDFQAFYDWAIANGYRKGLSIDRIDVNGDYSPSNCRWATPKEQANNRRNTPYITYNGMTKTQREWDDYFGLKPGTINHRLCHGIPANKILQGLMPNAKARFITYQGKTMSIRQWDFHLGIKYPTLVGRLTTRGWPIEKALSVPTMGT